jgi:hypothetical protein
MDLAGRKLGLEGGEGVRALIADMRAGAAALAAHEDSRLPPIGQRLTAAIDAAEAATAWISERRGQPDGFAGATAYLKLMGDVIGGWLLGRGALAAADGRAGDEAYAAARIGLCSHYAETVLAQVPGQTPAVTTGAAGLLALDAAALGG